MTHEPTFDLDLFGATAASFGVALRRSVLQRVAPRRAAQCRIMMAALWRAAPRRAPPRSAVLWSAVSCRAVQRRAAQLSSVIESQQHAIACLAMKALHTQCLSRPN